MAITRERSTLAGQSTPYIEALTMPRVIGYLQVGNYTLQIYILLKIGDLEK